jgi:hypothetical protein
MSELMVKKNDSNEAPTYANKGSASDTIQMDASFTQRRTEQGQLTYNHPPINLAWLIDALGERYEVRDEPVVMRYLWENPFLVSLLWGAREQIDEHFGLDAGGAVRVITDPEAESDQRLFLSVQTELPPEEALARLDELDRGWWLRVLPSSRGKMTIDIEYV